jgi:hypothetical protein
MLVGEKEATQTEDLRSLARISSCLRMVRQANILHGHQLRSTMGTCNLARAAAHVASKVEQRIIAYAEG